MITSINEFRQYLKENTDAHHNISLKINDLKEELNDLKQRRTQLDIDMENEAGQMGDAWTDEDANRYGGLMNDLDEEIQAKMIEVNVAQKELEETKTTEDDDDTNYYSGLEDDLFNNIKYIKDFRARYPNATLDDEANEYKRMFSLNSTIDEIKLALFDLDEEIANAEVFARRKGK
jgi:chromosome segregation ATPase